MKIKIENDGVTSYPINKIYALLATDTNGNDGMISVNGLPAIFSDPKFLESFRSLALATAKEQQTDTVLRLVEFTNKKVLEEF